jgi:hypothetical protein
VTPEEREFFRTNGYVSLGQIYEGDELARMVEVFDRDREERAKDHWYKFGHWQTVNCDAVFTSPEFDDLIRHPKAMAYLADIMGDDICFAELCARHMDPYDGEFDQGWHRDRSYWTDHPLHVDYMQLMVYLTDVHEGTHCFSISPQGVDDDRSFDNDAQLERGGIVDIHGPAGTGLLFNVATLHTATTRPTQSERKTAQVYYGFTHRPHLSEDSVMPPALWRDHPDEETRRFYGLLNGKTRDYMEVLEERGDLSYDDAQVVLRELDVRHGRRRV